MILGTLDIVFFLKLLTGITANIALPVEIRANFALLDKISEYSTFLGDILICALMMNYWQILPYLLFFVMLCLT